MNGKQGAVGLAVLFAIVYFISGMIIYQFVKPVIAESRVSMACTAPTSWGDMFVCLIFDGIIPYMVIGILATAGSILTKEAIG